MSGTVVTGRHIGMEAQPVVIVDGFHPAPDTLREAAKHATFALALRHYPGVRAEIPAGYFLAVRSVLAPVLREAFGAATIDLLDASFSIVTTPPTALSVQQRLPHVDAVLPGRIALVHYLSPEGGDGTAFFRHRATGFETIDETRGPGYFAQVEAELRDGGVPAGYMHDSDARFERIAHVAARYNRAVIYRSASLHSGAISPGARLDADPATGRLTITAFLSVA